MNITIIPAQPGYKILYGEDDGELFAVEAVIAWRIETEEEMNTRTGLNEYRSQTSPVTAQGEPAENWAGLLQPDGSVDCMGQDFSSLDDAIAYRKEQSALFKAQS